MESNTNPLKAIDALVAFLDVPRNSHTESEHVEAMKASRAAVAELVDANREYDAANANYGGQNHYESAADEFLARARLNAARSRRAAALAKFA